MKILFTFIGIFVLTLSFTSLHAQEVSFGSGQSGHQKKESVTKGKPKSTTAATSLVVRGNLTCLGNITVNSGGEINVDSSGQLMMDKTGTTPEININGGGSLRISGTQDVSAKLSRSVSGNYLLNINSGGTISAKYGIIEFAGGQKGISITSGATVDPLNSFYQCTIRTGTASIPGSAQMTVASDQNVVLQEPVFTQSGATYNIHKTNNAGRVLVGASSGNFTGVQFENDQYNRVDWGGSAMVQSVSIPSGWSGLSSYVLPSSYAVSDLMSGIMPQFVLLESMDLVYYPSLGINTLVGWAGQSAYKIKTTDAATLNISGYSELNHTFPLTSGWNLTPVICNQEVDAVTLFNAIGSSFIVAKEVASNKIYWPAYGINTIGSLLPGKSYFVKVSAPATIQFPVNTVNATVIYPELTKSTLNTPWNEPVHTAASHLIAILPEALHSLKTGDIIGAFTIDGTCTGINEISSTESPLPLAVFADDPMTQEKEGFSDGEPIQFKIFNQETGKILGLTAIFDQSLPDSYIFVTEGLSVVKSLETLELSIDEDGNYVEEIQVFPNPANEVVYISGNDRYNKLEIIGIDGKALLSNELNPGDINSLDISKLPAGFYQIKFSEKGNTLFKKLIVN